MLFFSWFLVALLGSSRGVGDMEAGLGLAHGLMGLVLPLLAGVVMRSRGGERLGKVVALSLVGSLLVMGVEVCLGWPLMLFFALFEIPLNLLVVVAVVGLVEAGLWVTRALAPASREPRRPGWPVHRRRTT